jgi:hypothetical protein
VVVRTSLFTESFLVGDADESGDAVSLSPHFRVIRWDDLENEQSAQMLWKIADDAKRRYGRSGILSLRTASSVPASSSGRLCEDPLIWRIKVKVSSKLLPNFLVHSRTSIDWL